MDAGNDLQSEPLAWVDKSLSGFFFPQFCGIFYNLSPRCMCSAVAFHALSSRSIVALCPSGVPKSQDLIFRYVKSLQSIWYLNEIRPPLWLQSCGNLSHLIVFKCFLWERSLRLGHIFLFFPCLLAFWILSGRSKH